jgi:hypothetical protein
MSTNKYHVSYPSTPGAAPAVHATASTIREARRIARDASRGRSDLRGQDVRIERPDGVLVEYAGVGS